MGSNSLFFFKSFDIELKIIVAQQIKIKTNRTKRRKIILSMVKLNFKRRAQNELKDAHHSINKLFVNLLLSWETEEKGKKEKPFTI